MLISHPGSLGGDTVDAGLGELAGSGFAHGGYLAVVLVVGGDVADGLVGGGGPTGQEVGGGA